MPDSPEQIHVTVEVGTDTYAGFLDREPVEPPVDPPPDTEGEPFLTSGAVGDLRNNFDGCHGYRFLTPSSDRIIVTALSRWKVAGNNQSHTISLKLADGTVIASAVVDLSVGAAEEYHYTPITPLQLQPNTEYYLMSSEVEGGDLWHSLGIYSNSGAVTLQSGAYQWDCAGNILLGSPGHCYIPANMKLHVPPSTWMVTFGDSKTNREGWQQILTANLEADGHGIFAFGNAGRPNATVADSVPGTPSTGVDSLSVDLPVDMRAHPERVSIVLMNWGVNDLDGPLTQSTWESQYSQIVEWAHAVYPNAKIYLAYPWRRGYDSECTVLHQWIDSVIASHSAYTFAGVDEAIVIKGNDDGAAATTDGVHHSNPIGITLYAEATQVSLGF